MLVVDKDFRKDLWSNLFEGLFGNDSVDLCEVLSLENISFEVLNNMEPNLNNYLLPFQQKYSEDKLLSFVV